MFKATRLASWDAAVARWAPLQVDLRPTPFQSNSWLSGWYGAMAARDTVEPVIVEVVDDAGTLAMLLPLVRLSGRLSAIEFADCSLTDYNMPILGPAAPTTAVAAEKAWAEVRRVLPAADLIVFTKMPGEVEGRPNPLTLALPTEVSKLFGNVVHTHDDYDTWMRSLDKHDRKELQRIWRVFTREPDTRFVRATTVDEGLRILAFIEQWQSERMRAMGRDYILDDPVVRDLYRRFVRNGIADGSVVITALTAGDEIVAGLFCVADDRRYCMVRFAFEGGRWSNASPGRLILERTIESGHRDGYRIFDFTIGDYAYKRDYKTTTVDLHDVTLALSLRGLPVIGLEKAKAFVKQRPALERVVRRVLNKTAA